jgi:soluble lytic murein transglycosylase-like protein
VAAVISISTLPKNTKITLTKQEENAIMDIQQEVQTTQESAEPILIIDEPDPMPKYDIPLSRELQRFTLIKCIEYGVDYKTIISIMKVESNFQTDLIGKKDYGIMQINKIHNDNFRKQGYTNILDPKQNIEYGISYFAYLYNEFDRNEVAALSAYHKGEFRLKKLLKRGITTTTYARKVLEFRDTLLEY